jgi:hypothetical protein
MSLQRIDRAQWPRVLERFSREHRAWLATVWEVRGDVEATRADARPLRSIAFEEPGRVAIQFADGSPELRIESARIVRIDADEGVERGLEIEAPDGITWLRFRAAARPDALDGLAPGER